MRPQRGFVRELRRKVVHLSGLIFPLVYSAGLRLSSGGQPLLTRRSATIGLGIITAVYFLVELMRFVSPRANEFYVRRLRFLLRRGEVRQVTGSGYYLLGSFIAVASFAPPIAVAAIVFMVVGDLAAAIVGKAYGRTPLLAGKTLEGSLACLVACFLTGAALFRHVGPSWTDGLLMAFIGATAAALAEVLPVRINDNVTMPMVSGVALLLAARWLGLDVSFP
jgi:glycerol-3-phosphate acyltransferase PlsY